MRLFQIYCILRSLRSRPCYGTTLLFRNGSVSWQRLEGEKTVHDRLVRSYIFAGEYLRHRTGSRKTRATWLVAIMADMPKGYVDCKG